MNLIFFFFTLKNFQKISYTIPYSNIISYDNIELNTKDLKIPHPLAYKRNFVLKPLKEITEFKIVDKKVKIVNNEHG